MMRCAWGSTKSVASSTPKRRRSCANVSTSRFVGYDFRRRTRLPRSGLRTLARLGALNAFCGHRRATLLAVERDLPAEEDLFACTEGAATFGSGVTAAIISLALELAGAPQVTLYDGFWAEHAARPPAGIERSDTP